MTPYSLEFPRNVMPFQDTPKVLVTGFPETSVNAFQNTRRHILEDSVLYSTVKLYGNFAAWRETWTLKIAGLVHRFLVFTDFIHSGTWGCWEDVRETGGLSRMEQFVIRHDYDDDTDDDDDDGDDDTKLTTVEAWYSSNSHCTENRKYNWRLKSVS